MKYPIILPQNSKFTELLITDTHENTYHGGARLTLSFIRKKYWIISGNQIVKKILRRCVRCRKHKQKRNQQIMGDLPSARVNQSRPFAHTGVDFTGHIYIKTNKGRGTKTTKGYVAVFVCMTTKAVHLELVSDLSTSSFIAALRRMASKRGTPQHLYSDNGRNFVGANKILTLEYKELQNIFSNEFMSAISNMEISWHFNAASWPSAGGLWEAAVKSSKYHLKRVIGDQKLTYEEMTTVLSQIEACLNSRPLCPISEDPDDLDFLTPAHFLASGPVLTIVETERDLRTRWQLTQRIFQDIWKRWRSEYLIQLSARGKWQRPETNMKLNDIVLINEDHLPAGKWLMGKIVELYPGTDGYVRVVKLKTKNGYCKRPVSKLTRLPVEAENSNGAPETSDQQNNINKPSDDIESQQSNKRSLRKRNKPQRFNFTSMAISFLLFFITIISTTEAIQTTLFKQDQGLYFDKVCYMRLVRDEWKIIIYYEMEPYWSDLTALNNYTNNLLRSCNAIREQSHCDIVITQLKHGISDLEYYNSMLLGQQSGTPAADGPSRRRRRRRGLIDGVGYVANSLFGVLDQRFAENYKKDIQQLRENQKHISLFWKNQTSIIEAQNNLLKRTADTINRQHKMINQHIIKLTRTLNAVVKKEEYLSILNEFTLGSIIASNLLNNLKTMQNSLVDTITDIYHGRFNPHLLTPEQIRDELSTIASQLTKDQMLAVDDVHLNIHRFYELLKVKARMLQDYLIFEVHLPLISRDTYEIYQIISIPQQKGSTMINLVPISEYIAISLKKDSYISMTASDVRLCKPLEKTYLCQIFKPIFQLKMDAKLCEMQNSKCKTIINKCQNLWLESHTINNYIYFCCDQCQLREICADQVTAHQLTSAGILNIDHDCIIKTDNFTVLGYKERSNRINIRPEIYAPVIAPINHIFNISLPQNFLNITSLDVGKDIADLDEKIKGMKENAEVLESDSLSFHDIHHYSMIYGIVVVISIIAAVVIVRRVRGRCRWQVPRAAEASQPQLGMELLVRPPPPSTVPVSASVSAEQSARFVSSNRKSEYAEPSARLVNKATSPDLSARF